MDFFHHGAPPPPFRLIWHLPTVCIMLWVFLQLFMNIRALSHLCRGAPLPLLPLLSLLPFLPLPPRSFLSPLPSNSHLGRQANKQLLLVPCCLLVLPLLTAHSMDTHTQRHTHANMLTPVQHHKLRGEYPLTQIRTHWSRPPWNNSGESQVNVTACKGQTARNVHTKAHRQCSCLNTRLS